VTATSDEDVSFSSSAHDETTCALTVAVAAADRHHGRWKCHLANTDRDDDEGIDEVQNQLDNSSLVAEAFLELLVATAASPSLRPRPETPSAVGDVFHFECSLEDAQVFPVPSLKFLKVNECLQV